MTPRCWRCAGSTAPCDLCSDRRIQRAVERARDAERAKALRPAAERQASALEAISVLGALGVVWLACAVAWVAS